MTWAVLLWRGKEVNTMKIYVYIISLLLLPSFAAQAQIDFGFSFGRLGTDRINDVRIGITARDSLSKYLKAEYRRQCPKGHKKLPEICRHTYAVFTGETLPKNGVHELDPAAAKLAAGFDPPGTKFVQSGLVIYLISWPGKIVVDSVTPWEKD